MVASIFLAKSADDRVLPGAVGRPAPMAASVGSFAPGTHAISILHGQGPDQPERLCAREGKLYRQRGDDVPMIGCTGHDRGDRNMSTSAEGAGRPSMRPAPRGRSGVRARVAV